ncbi:MAG: response regulator [Nisaea sp.]
MGSYSPYASNVDEDDDALVFMDEASDIEDGTEFDTDSQVPWRILIVDDDPDVHQSTLFALGGETIHGRNLHFHHAYSGAEAIDVLSKCDGISVILLDVVMETPDAGLKLAHYIRETLGQDDIRIILRTGQPGLLSEREARENDEINRYVLKSQITRTMLMDVVASELLEYLGSEA